MNTEYFVVNNGTQWKIVENLSTILPGVRISIFSVDFIIKTINRGNLSENKNKYTWTHDFLEEE